MILADALCYAHSFSPRAIINAATLTGKHTHTYAHYITLCFQVHVLILFPPSIFMVLAGAMDVALGSAATGVFTNSDWLWERLHKVMSEITHNLVLLYFLEHVLVTIKRH